MKWYRRLPSVAIAPLIVVFVIAVIAASPLALQFLAHVHKNWALLSNIGQSYGAVSAVFSGLAFLGVAFALIFQAAQNRENRKFFFRETHLSLVRMAIDDERLLAIFGKSSWSTALDNDVTMYANLYMNFLASQYELGGSEHQIKYVAKDMFDSAASRAYWNATRHGWMSSTTGKRPREFVALIDTEYQRAIMQGPPSRPMPIMKDQISPGTANSLLRRLRRVGRS